MRKITGMLTPQNLKIRLDGDFCERLPLQNKTVGELLQEIEAFVSTSKWLIFIVGIFAFFFRMPNNELFLVSLLITIIVSFSSWIHPLFSFVHFTITSSVPRFFVTLTGWFVDKIALIVLGFLTVGWKGLLYYAGGYILGTFLGYLLNIFLAKSNYTKFGVALQSDENAFIFLSLQYLKKFSYFDWVKTYYEYLCENE